HVAETRAPKTDHPHRATTALSPESVIESVSPQARRHMTRQPAEADMLKSDAVATISQTELLPVETSWPVMIRRSEPTALDNKPIRHTALQPQAATRPLTSHSAAIQQPPTIRREEGTAPDQILSSRPKETSVTARDHLPAPQSGVERVIIEHAMEGVEKPVADARM